MPSKKSGGKRAVEKKHDERNARRRRHKFDEKAWRKKYADRGAAPEDATAKFEWAAGLAALAIEEAAADPGLPPEQRRDQIIRGVAQLAKVLPSAELAADLRLFKKHLDELTKPNLHGASVDSRASGAGKAPPPRS